MVLGLERMGAGDLESAEQLMDQAVPILEEKGPPQLAVEALAHRGIIHVWRCEYQSAKHVAEEGLRRSLELGVEVNYFQSISLRDGDGKPRTIFRSVGGPGRRRAAGRAERRSHRLSRFPNTRGWLHSELEDLETALRLNQEGVQLAREVNFPKAAANSHINLAHDYLLLGEPARALEHLQEAERLYDQNVLLRWRFNIRLQAELSSYALAHGDLEQATSRATASLQQAERVNARKHMAWAHKLLGDIATLEERVEDGARHYSAAVGVLERHPCPIIEWKILNAAAVLAKRQKNDSSSSELLGARGRSCRAWRVQLTITGCVLDFWPPNSVRRPFLLKKRRHATNCYRHPVRLRRDRGLLASASLHAATSFPIVRIVVVGVIVSSHFVDKDPDELAEPPLDGRAGDSFN